MKKYRRKPTEFDFQAFLVEVPRMKIIVICNKEFYKNDKGPFHCTKDLNHKGRCVESPKLRKEMDALDKDWNNGN